MFGTLLLHLLALLLLLPQGHCTCGAAEAMSRTTPGERAADVPDHSHAPSCLAQRVLIAPRDVEGVPPPFDLTPCLLDPFPTGDRELAFAQLPGRAAPRAGPTPLYVSLRALLL